MYFKKGSLLFATLARTATLKRSLNRRNVATLGHLQKIGTFEDPRVGALPYDTGQLFYHKVLGCRGVVLFSWLAKVNDRSNSIEHLQKYNNKFHASNISSKFDEHSFHSETTEPYYEVLIDERDLDHIRLESDGHTVLNFDDTKKVSVLPFRGLESVSHDDILPYCQADNQLFQHKYLSTFLTHDRRKDPALVATKQLSEWQMKYTSWLECSTVNKETTNNIRVTVVPFYMGCMETSVELVHYWRYTIRLENLGSETVTLRERWWRIVTNPGQILKAVDKGVLKQEPVLSPHQRVFQYSSHIRLNHPNGQMWGTYVLMKEDGTSFECRIPPFSLDSKPDERVDPISFILSDKLG